MCNSMSKKEKKMAVIVLITGIWLASQAFIMKTKNMQSSIYFKVIPFFLGVANLLFAAKLFNWV